VAAGFIMSATENIINSKLKKATGTMDYIILFNAW